MATQIAETAGGEEEVYELEEGVLVRKTGGVKLPPRQSINVAEIQAQMVCFAYFRFFSNISKG